MKIVRIYSIIIFFFEITKKVLGGICFCLDNSFNIGCIHLLAISKDYQFKGIGSRLINKLKSIYITKNLSHIAMFADNNSIQFFEKKGFQKRKAI